MEIIILATIFLMGLCVGSFINMAVYRYAVKNELEEIATSKTPRNDINSQRSYCDYCGKQLHWYHNIPVVSWLGLGGKSSCCKKKLSVFYPVVEIMTALLMVVAYMKTGSVVGVILVAVMIFSTVVDLKYMILPDEATIALIILSILLLLGRWPASLLLEILSALGAAGFLGGLYLLTKGKGMGLGDVKLALAMGLLLGYPKILVAFYVAFIVGAMVGGTLIILGKAKTKTMLPFGPFLLLGTVVAWWWWKSIWYLVFGI